MFWWLSVLVPLLFCDRMDDEFLFLARIASGRVSDDAAGANLSHGGKSAGVVPAPQDDNGMDVYLQVCSRTNVANKHERHSWQATQHARHARTCQKLEKALVMAQAEKEEQDTLIAIAGWNGFHFAKS